MTDELTAEAAQYAWTPEPARQADPRLHPDPRPTSVQLRDALVAAEVQRHKQVHWLHLLQQIGQTLGAGETDLEELPALVDGLRTTTDQLRIQAADHRHQLEQPCGSCHPCDNYAPLKTAQTIADDNDTLRDHLHKARLATAQAEARAGAYLLAHDHLDAVTRTLVGRIGQHIAREPLGVHHLLTQTDRDRLLDATDTVHNALSRDLESYLAEPYDDITPDTRVDLTPAGLAVAATLDSAADTQELPRPGTCRCTWLGIGTPEHPTAALCLTPEQDRANRQRFAGHVEASSVPPVAREDVAIGEVCRHVGGCDCSTRRYVPPMPAGAVIPGEALALSLPQAEDQGDPARTDRALQTIGVVADIVAARLGLLGQVDYQDGTTGLLSVLADEARRDRKHAEACRDLSWLDILVEAFWSAMVEQDPARLRPALVRLAALTAAWAEAIDRRQVDEDQAEVQG